MNKIDLTSLRLGDRVTIPVTFVVRGPADLEGDVRVTPDFGLSLNYLWSSHRYFGLVDRADRDIEVGDTVVRTDIPLIYRRPATVLLLDDDRAVIKFDVSKKIVTVNLTDLDFVR